MRSNILVPNLKQFNMLPPIELARSFLLTDDVTDEEFLTYAKTAQHLAYAHYFIGLKAFVDKDWPKAKRCFEASTAADCPIFSWGNQWSSAFLAQMERDPNWPYGRSDSTKDIEESDSGDRGDK